MNEKKERKLSPLYFIPPPSSLSSDSFSVYPTQGC
jgi:hypothetical protein